MKIVRLSTFLDFGGLEKRLINISHVKDNNEWIFACLNKTGYAAGAINKAGKRVVNLKAKPTIYSIITTYKVYQFLLREKPDVLHTSGAEANFHGIIAGKLAGVKKIVAEEIGISGQSKRGRMVFKYIYKFANAIIGNSKPVVDSLRKKVSIPDKKLYQVNNPIIFSDLETLHFHYSPHSAYHIISISRLTHVKNIPAIIHVVSKLLEEHYNLYYHIYGEGEEKASLQQLVKKLNLEDKIIFHGFESNPLEKLKAADIFILNSYTEGFSNALCEAMYAKKIAISTKSGSAEDMITHGESGFLINVDDEENLYNQIKEVLALPKNIRQQIQESAHHKVVTSYSLDKHLKELYSIYNS